jgi:hypothetical protein
MSAYVCNDETINSVVSILKTASYQEDHHVYNDNSFPALDTDLKKIVDENEAIALGYLLRAFNEYAVLKVYPDCEVSANLPGPVDENGKLAPFVFKATLPPTRLQAVKTLACFTYQCFTGATKDHPLYVLLESYKNQLSFTVLLHSPAWEKVEWQ